MSETISESTSMPIKFAATVVIIRDGDPQYEIFMLRRTSKAVFAGGMYVFPGGMVDDTDTAEAHQDVIAPPSPAQAGQTAAVGPDWQRFWIAGIRETFEEGGFLLAYDESGEILSYNAENEQRFIDYRGALHRGEISLFDICRQEKLRLALDRIHYYNRLITPPGRSRRFDTNFFIAMAPKSQSGFHDGFETVDNRWISPGEALAAHEQETFGLMRATKRQLDEFHEHKTTSALMNMVETKSVFTTLAMAQVPA